MNVLDYQKVNVQVNTKIINEVRVNVNINFLTKKVLDLQERFRVLDLEEEKNFY